MRNVVTRLAAAALVAAVLSGGSIVIAEAPRNPDMSAPVTGGAHGQPFGAATPAGYVEEERFFSGTATSYAKAGTWGVDGKWDVKASVTAPYKVRMLVRRPADPRRFVTRTADMMCSAGLQVQKMIAIGRSQPAFRLVTYINAIHPLAHLFDGYFVHSRGSAAAGLTADGLGRDANAPVPSGAHIRPDIDVPPNLRRLS